MKFIPLFCFGFFSLALSASEVLTVRLPKGAMQPRVAVAEDKACEVVFAQGEPEACDVKIATLSAAGSLGDPIKVNTPDTRAGVKGTVRGPTLALGGQGVRLVLWHGKQGSATGGKGSALWFARVDGEGKVSPPRDLMGGTAALDGGAAITADGSGNVWVVWHGQPAGMKGEAERRLFVRHSKDHGATFSEEWAVKGEDKGICGCCGLAAAMEASGAVQILYRIAEGGTQRGTRVIRLPANANAATAPELLQKDRWTMPGCPMTTAALVPTASDMTLAWVTEFQLRFGGLKAAPEAGKSGAKAGQNHPRFASNAQGESVVIWTEGAMWGKGGELVVQTFNTAGKAVSQPVRQALPLWSYGACAGLPDGRFVVIF
jgi:hypothetical protein